MGLIKGNSVRVSEIQFPEIYQVIQEFSNQLEIPLVPECYILQSGGILNAFASRLSRKNIIILTTEVAELAYHGNFEALKFIIAHELGHIKRQHPFWMAVLYPATLIPFLGRAYSRACEYTCDRIAADLSPNGAVPGLLILSAGKEIYQKIDMIHYAEQGRAQFSFWVYLAEIFSTHPLLPKRISAVLKQTESEKALNLNAELSVAAIN